MLVKTPAMDMKENPKISYRLIVFDKSSAVGKIGPKRGGE